MIRELVEMTKSVQGLISFAGGFPSPATFPKEELAEIFAEETRKNGNDLLQYGSTGGDTRLKTALVNSEPGNLTPEEISVCPGGTNGIYTVLRTFIEPGDYIISEEPSFLGSLIAFDAVGAKVVSVSMDDNGLIVDELVERLEEIAKIGGRVKLLYTIPDFQNPSGVTMSRENRLKIIELAAKYNFLILEDDPYSQLRYYGDSVESLYYLAKEVAKQDKTVITVRSYSKILGPGLRIGYILAHPEIIGYLNSWAQKISLSTDRVIQQAVAVFLEKDMMKPHIAKIRDFYRPLRDCMVDSLKKYLPDTVQHTEPNGGMFVWLTLPEELSGDDLFHKALENKVAFVPGSQFYLIGQEKRNGLRLNFSYPTEEQIVEGIKRLANIL
ncbi:MAG: PLP-dependent aminotransferase family protein, partial [Candidatus Cloacimonas sp.]